MTTVGPASIGDLAVFSGLLAEAGLPDRVGSRPGDIVVVARDGDTVVAGAAVERYGGDGLLRSVVVAGPHRGTGLGRWVVGSAIEAASSAGIGTLYLLTETAAGYFERFGFAPVGRDSVPPDIGASEEFAVLCPDTAVAMRRSREHPPGLTPRR